MKIAYLASAQSLPGPKASEIDALEHQQMLDTVRPAFEEKGMSLVDFAWDEENVAWDEFAAVIIGTTWDYCDRHAEFLQALDAITAQTLLMNTPEIVRWNSQKTYLRGLEEKGIPVVPTIWLDDPEQTVNWQACFDQLNTDKLVVKRQVGAGAAGQFLLAPDEQAPVLTHAMMVQPFLNSIVKEGEYSVIFIDGTFSHALIKRPKDGDYRIQAYYGGQEEAVDMSPSDIDAAQNVLSSLPEMPLYARVDMVRGGEGSLVLMELELVEPFLYPMQSTRLGELLSSAVLKRLA